MDHALVDGPLSRWYARARRSIYSPLDSTRKEIRLLKLLPSRRGRHSSLRCTLTVYALENSLEPSYETISYAWGDPLPAAKVVVNSFTLLFPQETQRALLRLRLPDRPRILWIDAVCINQVDLVERGEQVAIMSDIYRRGIRNIVYLGDDRTGNVFEAAKSLNAVYETEMQEDTDNFKTIRTTLNDPQGRFVWSEKPLRTQVSVSALRDFFSRPWFSRLWIVPEAVHARQSTCIVGNLEIDLFVVATAATWIYWHKETTTSREEFGPGMGLAGQLGILLLFESHSNNMTSLFRATMGRQATDCRDKVFSILGLLSRGKSGAAVPDLLKPDYNKSLRDVVRDATRYGLSSEDDLELLGSWDHRSDGDLTLDGFCSWATPLHLTHSAEDVTCSLPSTPFSCGLISSRGSLQPSSKDAIPDLDVLELRGFYWDSVRWRSPRLARPVSIDTMLQLIQDLGSRHDLGLTLTAGQLEYECKDGPNANLTSLAFEAYHNYIAEYGEHPTINSNAKTRKPTNKDLAAAWWATAKYCFNRRVIITESGTLALAPRATKEGDIVAILYRGRHPYILRPLGTVGDYQLVGRTYIHDIMKGEAISQCTRSKNSETVFRLR